MSERGPKRGRGSGTIWLRGALVVFIVAGVLGVFGPQTRLQRPALSAVNIIGIVLMLLGLMMTLLALRIGDMIARGQRDVSPMVKMAGVLVCGVGAALVFI